MKLIQSRDNLFFKELVKLAGSARQRNKSKQTLLDGTHLLAAYLDAGLRPQHILLNDAAAPDDEIAQLLGGLGEVAVTQLDAKLFVQLSELKTSTGILALIELPQPQLAIAQLAIAQSRFVLLLEDIQDPGNLGSILRSAAAAGCDTVFLSGGCADAWSPKVLRAAMGGHFCLQIFEQQPLAEVALAFTGALLATSVQATHSLYDCDIGSKVALLIGNEGSGLSDELLHLATQHICIPMHGKMESLNVAAATAICLFEIVRQRQ